MKLIPEPRSADEMERLNSDEKLLLQARRNLLLAAHTLAQSLLTVGEPKMAATVAVLTSPNVEVELTETATALLNKEKCDCVYTVEKMAPNPPHWRGEQIRERNYLSLGRFWCEDCNGMVTAYKCFMCGSLMHSLTTPDENHAQLEAGQINKLAEVSRG